MQKEKARAQKCFQITKRIKSKKFLLFGSVILLIVCLSGVGLVFIPKISKADTTKSTRQEVYVQKGNLAIGTTVSGTTASGSEYETFPIAINDNNLTNKLEIEKVYVEEGNSIEIGEPLLKITQESAEAAQSILQKAVETTKAALAESEISYQTDLLSLQSEYQVNLSLDTTAKEEYESKLENLEQAVTLAEEELTKANDILKTNPTKITDLKGKIAAEKKKQKSDKKQQTKASTEYHDQESAYEKAQNNYTKTKEAYEEGKSISNYIEAYLETEKKESTQEEDDFQKFRKQVSADLLEKERAFHKAEAVLKKEKSALEVAATNLNKKEAIVSNSEKKLSNREKELSKLTEELENAKNSLKDLKVNYEKALTKQTTEKITIEQAYEANLITFQNAGKLYEIEKNSLENSVKEARRAYEEAKENLEAYEENIKDGIFYAKKAGTIAEVGYTAEDILSDMTPVAAYENSQSLDIAVTVEQSDIASIAVGDAVSVSMSGGRPGQTGTVAKIDMTSVSSSASKVNYTVTLSLDNSEGIYTNGQTAEVYFVKETLENILYLSEAALLTDSRGTYVKTKNAEGEISETVVTTGSSNGDYIEIKEGLEEGNCCIVEKEAE